MNKIAGAILMLAAAVAGHAVFTFVANHVEIERSDIPKSVTNMVMFAIAATTVLGLWGAYFLFRNDPR
jgi:hypothetical protein